MRDKRPIPRLTMIGVGLIGGSLIRALRAKDYLGHVVGWSRHTEKLEQAKSLGVIDEIAVDPESAIKNADVIVLAVPMSAMPIVMQTIKPYLMHHQILTDVGSSKEHLVCEAEKILGEFFNQFVPGHPIAGTEQSGVNASFAELYQGRQVILTPTDRTNPAAIERVSQMWSVAGASVTQMSARHHDEVLAATSHLPHVLAYSLVDTLSHMHDKREIFQYAAGGFKDFTRIASSDPLMWRDICLDNREAILDALQAFDTNLKDLRTLIENTDGDQLLASFTRAKTARDSLLK